MPFIDGGDHVVVLGRYGGTMKAAVRRSTPRAGHRREVVDRREQPREHTLAHSLWTNVGIAIGKRTTLRFAPADG